MQVRVDDDMRVILTLTSEEYALLGGTKETVSDFVEEEIDIVLRLRSRLNRMVAAGSDSAAAPEVTKTEPEPVIVTPNAEFAIPAGSFAETAGTSVTTPEVMTE